MVGEVRNRRLALRQTVEVRRGRAVGHPDLVADRRGRRGRVVLRHRDLVADRRGRAAVHRGRRIGAVGHPDLVADRRGRVADRRGRAVGPPARVGRGGARWGRVLCPSDAVQESGLEVVLSRANCR